MRIQFQTIFTIVCCNSHDLYFGHCPLYEATNLQCFREWFCLFLQVSLEGKYGRLSLCPFHLKIKTDTFWASQTATTDNVQNISHGFYNKVEVKCTLVQALRLCTGRTAHRGSRGVALPFHDHSTERG